MPKFFATCPKGLESLLLNELINLNVDNTKETVAGVAFSGDMTSAMKVCLYSRFASRILLTLNTFKCEDDSDLYLGAQGIAYEKYFSSQKSIAVSFSGSNKFIRNTQYGALRVKDAICDRFVACKKERPNVDKHHAEVRIFALLKKGEVTISLDLSNSAQFWHDYNRTTGIAPLKENLAAAIVTRAGYKGEGHFIDPMCGAATLLIEAALIASNSAPNLQRHNFGFMHLLDYDESAWRALLVEAQNKALKGREQLIHNQIKIIGFDADIKAVERARENIKKANLSDIIQVEHVDIANIYNPCANSDLPITIATNPPYGERMGNFNELISLYTLLGQQLKQHFKGARAAIISSSNELLSCLRLSYDKSYRLFNGALECQLRVFALKQDYQPQEQLVVAEAYANRLEKNLRKLEKWAKKENIEAYRVYDADIPEYNAAVDRYGDKYIIQEYQAPSKIPPHVAKQRLLDMIAATINVTHVGGDDVIIKSREKQRGDSQYEKREDASGNLMVVNEGECQFLVNLHDYLDTGLFLDARPIRRLIASLAPNKDMLNLFAYTSSASLVAAKAQAKSTTSVDMSRTYLDWGVQNFKCNHIDLHNHHFIQADCLNYLSQDQGKLYDLIYIDPPTFSNSKRMEKSFDIERDHVQLLGNLTRHLKDEGIVIFCTNKRNFKLDNSVKEFGFSIEDITLKTYDLDFARDKKLHTCFKFVYHKAQHVRECVPLVNNIQKPKWSKDIAHKKEGFTFSAKKNQRFNTRKDETSANKAPIVRKVRVWGPSGVKDI